MLVHVCELCNKITICFEMLFIFKLQWNQLLRSQFGEFWYQYLIKCDFNSGVGNFYYRRPRFSLGSCMLKYAFRKSIFFFFRIMTNTMKYFFHIVSILHVHYMLISNKNMYVCLSVYHPTLYLQECINQSTEISKEKQNFKKWEIDTRPCV